MPTVLISANDTGVGKTWVSAAIARLLVGQGATVQKVKPVETGIEAGGHGDAEFVHQALQDKATLPGKASVHTLRRFTKPMAPVEAAREDGAELCFDELVREIDKLPDCDWRIVEGAGGLCVPLEGGSTPRDWADFALAIKADYVVLVVQDRLGAINQARLLAHYAGAKGLKAGWWLNEAQPDTPNDIRIVNNDVLEQLAFPLWAVQDYGVDLPRRLEASWLTW
ncbi:dethiobiotin synthase [Cerasicoccus maritimus]|uniref:dethiobiotin synthase n=1 Tax=Cerasicoccus maritimus TaxID=490089 RepID=UPI002852D97E|nr:dethiobiotin synthase [Cerasicoccus maritimus]